MHDRYAYSLNALMQLHKKYACTLKTIVLVHSIDFAVVYFVGFSLIKYALAKDMFIQNVSRSLNNSLK